MNYVWKPKIKEDLLLNVAIKVCLAFEVFYWYLRANLTFNCITNIVICICAKDEYLHILLAL